MKQKFLVPMLVLLAFGVLLFFSGNSALAMDESTDTAIVEADQYAQEGDDQIAQEEVPVEKELPSEDKLSAPELQVDNVNKVESDHEAHEREEEQNLENNGENQAPEGEVTTGNDNENDAPAEEPVVEDGSQHNQHEGEPGTGSEPAEQQAPEN